jgi:hypothetical protein
VAVAEASVVAAEVASVAVRAASAAVAVVKAAVAVVKAAVEAVAVVVVVKAAVVVAHPSKSKSIRVSLGKLAHSASDCGKALSRSDRGGLLWKIAPFFMRVGSDRRGFF